MRVRRGEEPVPQIVALVGERQWHRGGLHSAVQPHPNRVAPVYARPPVAVAAALETNDEVHIPSGVVVYALRDSRVHARLATSGLASGVVVGEDGDVSPFPELGERHLVVVAVAAAGGGGDGGRSKRVRVRPIGLVGRLLRRL